MKVTIIIPTYNERGNVRALIGKIFDIVPDVHILVVDDSSPDGTADEVRSLSKIYPNLHLLVRSEKVGLGKAYIHAFQNVLADPSVTHVLMMDADHSHDPKSLPEMLELSKTNDVVIGSRYIKNGGIEGWEWWRRMLSKYGNLYYRVLTRMPIHDCTGGFNVIAVNVLKKVDFSTFYPSGYAFIMELKYRLYVCGASLVEVPIVFKNRIEGESKISSHIISEGIIAPWKLIFKRW